LDIGIKNFDYPLVVQEAFALPFRAGLRRFGKNIGL